MLDYAPDQYRYKDTKSNNKISIKGNIMDKILSLPKPTRDRKYLSEIIYEEVKSGIGKKEPLIIHDYITEEKCNEIMK